ncbi:uncharacterized protein BX664DRAFT_328561 [Halteromyces radiatus]|uniref:uncharacterized protein n=1 Tax=Halteromyces radiatus TaxID=101107 RepID=UPI00221E91CE|nr:uncharacterized protein BX664DRAFT_328561 [Halteromyces radiatus]KAI8092945.1 hypothetical protein BX664DRAFT_328561 [Halteromyces radiatus]
MQQQEILFRKTTFSLLSRAESLKQTWDTYQSATLALLSTLDNLHRQQCNEHRLDQYQVDGQRLLYKQTQRFDKCMVQLATRLDQWKTVVQDWQQLAKDAQHNANKAMSFINNNNKAVPLSSHSLIQVTAVSPTQAYEWISQLAYLYHRQYHCKRMLFIAIPSSDLSSILEQWSTEAFIQHHPVTRCISDRLQLYKHVKKTIESI